MAVPIFFLQMRDSMVRQPNGQPASVPGTTVKGVSKRATRSLPLAVLLSAHELRYPLAVPLSARPASHYSIPDELQQKHVDLRIDSSVGSH